MRDWLSRVSSVLARHPRVTAASGGGLLAVIAGVVAAFLLLTGAPAYHPPVTEPSSQVAAARKASPMVASPFTGEPVSSLGPVLGVKIDNIVNARPQTGLASADVVYALPVEGGLSRFLAIFSSHVPSVIGPVRSAREDDLALLRQFGTPAFAFSGAAPHLLPFVERARVADLFAGLPPVAPAYFRDDSRVAPYNLYAQSKALLAHARGASDARDIGFRFGQLPAKASGPAVSSVTAGYPSASFTFAWSAQAGKWLIAMDGAPAMVFPGGPGPSISRLAAPTIIIQHTVIRTSRFLEYGKPPPYAESTGQGTAQVLRGGHEYTVHWSRPAADGGAVYTLPSGARMTFAPGQVWVLLVH
jgi:hypothetical protein